MLLVPTVVQWDSHRELVHGQEWQWAAEAGALLGEIGWDGKMSFCLLAIFQPVTRAISKQYFTVPVCVIQSIIFISFCCFPYYQQSTRQNEDVRPHVRERFRLHDLLPPDWTWPQFLRPDNMKRLKNNVCIKPLFEIQTTTLPLRLKF